MTRTDPLRGGVVEGEDLLASVSRVGPGNRLGVTLPYRPSRRPLRADTGRLLRPSVRVPKEAVPISPKT
jgi:hypothetical protein